MGKHISVLIVDDQKPMREWVRSQLEPRGFQIAGEAGDGYKAVAMAQVLNPDLVLLDLGMPGLNGIETAFLLRKANPQMKIIFLTQNSDPEVMRAALEDGARGFLFKCDAGTELLPAIDAVLKGEQFASRRLTIKSC